eukprot:7902110-Alexandrium_andersonii.AAC.1
MLKGYDGVLPTITPGAKPFDIATTTVLSGFDLMLVQGWWPKLLNALQATNAEELSDHIFRDLAGNAWSAAAWLA